MIATPADCKNFNAIFPPDLPSEPVVVLGSGSARRSGNGGIPAICVGCSGRHRGPRPKAISACRLCSPPPLTQSFLRCCRPIHLGANAMAPVPNQPLRGPSTCLLLTYLRFCATVSRRLCATCWPTCPHPSLPRGRTRPRKGSAAVLLSPGPLQKVTSTRNMLRIELHVNGSKYGSSKFLPATPQRNLAIRLFSRHAPINRYACRTKFRTSPPESTASQKSIGTKRRSGNDPSPGRPTRIEGSSSLELHSASLANISTPLPRYFRRNSNHMNKNSKISRHTFSRCSSPPSRCDHSVRFAHHTPHDGVLEWR